jgi:hypothetical protein
VAAAGNVQAEGTATPAQAKLGRGILENENRQPGGSSLPFAWAWRRVIV